jgi:DNA-binding LacI/PurR family transcriptional regulator
MEPPMPVTVKDIARKAGVSHSTVSRALHSNPLISDETTQRIQKIAVDMGYLPSAAARALKTNRSQVLGVVLSSLHDPFFSEILEGIEERLQGSHYSLFIAAGHRDPEREREILQTMVQHRVDGVIICSTTFSEEQSGQLLAYGVPIVVVNNQAAEDFRYSIYHDDVDGSRQVTRHLIELGHRKIAYIGNSLSGRTSLDRLSGFRQEMDSARLAVSANYILEVPGSGPEQGAAIVEHFLGLSERPTALVCFNDMMAVGVLGKLQKAGLRVPEDISLTGFDNIVFSAYTNPPLTTLDQPKKFIGAEAARLLLDLLNQDPHFGAAAPLNVTGSRVNCWSANPRLHPQIEEFQCRISHPLLQQISTSLHVHSKQKKTWSMHSLTSPAGRASLCWLILAPPHL